MSEILVREINDMVTENAALKAEIKRLRAALEFYRDAWFKNWYPNEFPHGRFIWMPAAELHIDGGTRARAVLSDGGSDG